MIFMELRFSFSIVIELFLASSVFCAKSENPHWQRIWLLALGCVIISSISAILVHMASAFINLNVIVASLFYAVVFAISTIVLAYTFQLDALEGLVIGTLGYCTQHFWNDICAVVLGPSNTTSLSSLEYYLLHTLILVIGYLITFLVVGRRFSVDEEVVRRRVPWIIGSALALFFVIVFTMIFADTQSGVARTVCYVYDALATSLIMLALILGSRVDGLRSSLAKQEALWEQKRSQYELTRESVDLINIKCHDIRKRVSAMGEVASLSPESLQEIRESIRVYDSGIKTGNDAIDVMLTQKSLLCSQRGVEFDCMVDGSALSFIADDDLYFLFTNILDNAIEAVLGLGDQSKRSIALTVKHVGADPEGNGGFVALREDNYFDGNLLFSEGLPQTTKGDTSNHGFGMRSIRRCVEQYGGELNVRGDDGIFTLTATIPIPSSR